MIFIHGTELYPILVHWAELYPILIHWAELYPILLHWTELYPMLTHCRTIPYLNTLSRTIPYLNLLSRTIPYINTLIRIIPCLNTLSQKHSDFGSSSRQPIRIEDEKALQLRQTFTIEYYVTRVVSQSESSITSTESSRLGLKTLLGSRLDSVRYSLS